MFFFLISVSVSLPSNCYPGTSYYQGNGPSTIIETALTPTQVYNDLHMVGSFCPPVTGQYRLIYEGTTNGGNDAAWSTYYWIQGSSVKSRTSDWFLLNDTSCYLYQSHVATQSIQAYGSVYYEKSGETKKLITKDVSYTCSSNFCKIDGVFPNCVIPTPYPSPTATPNQTPFPSPTATPFRSFDESLRTFDPKCNLHTNYCHYSTVFSSLLFISTILLIII